MVDTGDYDVGTIAANVVSIVSIVSDIVTDFTVMVVMEGAANAVNDTASILLANATITGGIIPSDPDLEFNQIGLSNVTLKSTTP